MREVRVELLISAPKNYCRLRGAATEACSFKTHYARASGLKPAGLGTRQRSALRIAQRRALICIARNKFVAAPFVGANIAL